LNRPAVAAAQTGSMTRPTFLDPAEGYRRWAPTYADETAISYLDDILVAALTPPFAGRRLLDAGCGTGRRLAGCGAASAVGVDASAAMLDAGIGRGAVRPGVITMLGDVRTLPLGDVGFDVVWCRLVVGHFADCAPAYRELARVAAPGARVIVTDFHPAAHAAGHRRTFRDGDAIYGIEHHVHRPETQIAAARDAGLTLVEQREAAIGEEVRPFYERAGRDALFETHRGLPVVLALAFRHEG
jgi:malonyl-CoA O-methyltransferase